jgi:hypothetical protein
MYERHSSIHSNNRNDDDQLLELTTPSNQGQERISLDILDEPIIGINSSDDKESDIEQLLDEKSIEPPVKDTFQCSKLPARYITAIWAFFGFFCLYAMRVNLSVAIVAMVRLLIK